jgi:hypothetical protein
VAAGGRWCNHIEAVTALVDCNGERHRVTWRRGKVVLEDHDLSAETAMLAFGGKPFPCLGVLRRWRDMHTWAMSSELFRTMSARLGPEAVLPGPLQRANELGLMLTWERAWRRLSFYTDYERLLLEQLQRRALPPLREHLGLWRRRTGARLLSSVEVEVLRPGRAPTLLGTMDTVRVRATAAIGVSWVLRVWARGLALVGDAFVLDVDDDEGPGDAALQVQAVRWEEGRGGIWSPKVRRARVSGDGDERSLAWTEPE